MSEKNQKKSRLLTVTTPTVAGKEVIKELGPVFGVGTVAFGPMTSNKAKGAMLKAMLEISEMGNDVGANAVVGMTTAAAGSGFAFFRAHTIILTGTAVKLS